MVCVCVCRLVDISHVMSEPVKDSESQSRASHQVLGGRHSFKTGHICSTYLTKHLQIRKLNLTLPLQQTQAKLHGFLNFLLYSCGVRISISAKVVWSFAKLGHRDMPLYKAQQNHNGLPQEKMEMAENHFLCLNVAKNCASGFCQCYSCPKNKRVHEQFMYCRSCPLLASIASPSSVAVLQHGDLDLNGTIQTRHANIFKWSQQNWFISTKSD